MSFSGEIKKELLQKTYADPALETARAHGLLRFAKQFSADAMLLQTESRETAHFYAECIFALIGISSSISVREYKNQKGKSFFTASVDRKEDREKILDFFGYTDPEKQRIVLPKMDSESLGAFAAGAFVACGSVVNPEKSYHAEFVVSSEGLCRDFGMILSGIAAPKMFKRRNNWVLYLKDSEEIEDLLTLMGAEAFSLELMNIKVYKSIRNRVNRVQNCEFANIEKTILASSAQTEQIRYILEKKGEDFLPEELREIALLRMENPEFSLRELGEALPEKLSRSGVNHRLKKLSEIYKELTEQDAKKGKGEPHD